MFDKIRQLERLLEPDQNDYLAALRERIAPIKGKISLGEDLFDTRDMDDDCLGDGFGCGLGIGYIYGDFSGDGNGSDKTDGDGIQNSADGNGCEYTEHSVYGTSQPEELQRLARDATTFIWGVMANRR